MESEVSPDTRKKWREKVETIIEANNYGCIELSEWEFGFIDSIYVSILSDKDLTFKQSSALSKIYEKVL